MIKDTHKIKHMFFCSVCNNYYFWVFFGKFWSNDYETDRYKPMKQNIKYIDINNSIVSKCCD